MNPISKFKALISFLIEGMNRKEQEALRRAKYPTLKMDENCDIRNPENFFPGEYNQYQRNVYINCGGKWSEGKGYFRTGKRVFLSANSVIYAAGGVEIGDDSAIGANAIISSQQEVFDTKSEVLFMDQGFVFAPIKIGKNVRINSGAMILKGVTIGDNVIVAANTLITKDIPANSLVMGTPAKVVRSW